MVDHPHWHAEVLTAASTKTREAAWSASLGGCLLRLALARDCDCSASFPMSLTLRRVRRSAPRVRLFVALLLVGVFSGCVEAPAVPTVDAAVKDMACECVPQESVFASYDPCHSCTAAEATLLDEPKPTCLVRETAGSGALTESQVPNSFVSDSRGVFVLLGRLVSTFTSWYQSQGARISGHIAVAVIYVRLHRRRGIPLDRVESYTVKRRGASSERCRLDSGGFVSGCETE